MALFGPHLGIFSFSGLGIPAFQIVSDCGGGNSRILKKKNVFLKVFYSELFDEYTAAAAAAIEARPTAATIAEEEEVEEEDSLASDEEEEEVVLEEEEEETSANWMPRYLEKMSRKEKTIIINCIVPRSP